jgi:hypothetical protein
MFYWHSDLLTLFETVIHLVQRHGHNCLMAKSDIEDAFRLLPIHPDDPHPLGFTWEGKYYYDTCLPNNGLYLSLF